MAPGDAEVLYLAVSMLIELGRWGEALPVLEYARDRNPLYLKNLGFLAQAYWLAGRWEDALGTGRTLLALDPSSPYAHGTISWTLLELGNLEEALDEAELEPDPVSRLQSVAFALYALGRQEEFERAFRQLREEYGESDPLWVVETYAHIEDTDAAFEWLDRLTPVPF